MLAVSYHVVGPIAWEYPYYNGQEQEDLPDRLVPASLYGGRWPEPATFQLIMGQPLKHRH